MKNNESEELLLKPNVLSPNVDKLLDFYRDMFLPFSANFRNVDDDFKSEVLKIHQWFERLGLVLPGGYGHKSLVDYAYHPLSVAKLISFFLTPCAWLISSKNNKEKIKNPHNDEFLDNLAADVKFEALLINHNTKVSRTNIAIALKGDEIKLKKKLFCWTLRKVALGSGGIEYVDFSAFASSLFISWAKFVRYNKPSFSNVFFDECFRCNGHHHHFGCCTLNNATLIGTLGANNFKCVGAFKENEEPLMSLKFRKLAGGVQQAYQRRVYCDLQITVLGINVWKLQTHSELNLWEMLVVDDNNDVASLFFVNPKYSQKLIGIKHFPDLELGFYGLTNALEKIFLQSSPKFTGNTGNQMHFKTYRYNPF